MTPRAFFVNKNQTDISSTLTNSHEAKVRQLLCVYVNWH